MSPLKHISLILLLLIGPQGALGCGPDFPEELLIARQDALKEPPPALFTKEIKRLIDKPRNEFAVIEDSEDANSVELQGITDDAKTKITSMRQAGDGDEAYLLGDGLPPAVRLYTAAALDFHRSFSRNEEDSETDNSLEAEQAAKTINPLILEQARKRFEAIAALPEQDALSRIVWATYMLGRIAGYQNNIQAAAENFQKTRSLVRSGLPDPMGLAVASLGEEAHLYLQPGGYEKAVAFYLQQLSYGSQSAEVSLKFVARKLAKNPELLDEALSTPLTRQLLFIFLYTKNVGVPFSSLYNYIDKTRGFDGGDEEITDNEPPPPEMIEIDPRGESYYTWNVDEADGSENANNQQTGEKDASAESEQEVEQPAPESSPALWNRIADAIERLGIQQMQGLDWLAAAAYNYGQYELAQRLVDHDSSPLAFWIKSKLALRNGKQEEALAALAKTVEFFPELDKPKSSDRYETYAGGDEEEDNSSEYTLLYRVHTEQGILNLARGDFVQAMHFLYQGSERYWMDAAYVAEKVLTLDELKLFVDQNVAIPDANERQAITETRNFSSGVRLRQLLARRLMRNNQVEEAITYFDDNELRKLAKEFLHDQQKASSWWRSDIAKAQAWYSAALLARFEGMELMGYEQGPDYTLWNGTYDPSPYAGGPTKLEAGAYVTAAEQQRFTANQANPYIRFHYRLVAANLASKAADLLPAHSQAFAAVLCHATSWNLTREPQVAVPFYKRYLQEGAYVPWGKNFGRRCREPEFDNTEQGFGAKPIHAAGFTIHLRDLLVSIFFLTLAALTGFVIRRSKH